MGLVWGLSPFLALFLGVAQAQTPPAEESPLGLAYVQTPDMRLIYLDPTLAYLEPYAVRTFANSMAWQRRIFGWRPYERVRVLLKDFSDYGNASAGAAPINNLNFDIAPLSLAFETYPASERMYSLMNHELVHVATMDMSTAEDRSWRGFFHGKIYPEAPHPESMLYSYLTVPRFTVPRWYLEGSAVFMETWMQGGLGRAQGGYDEMVFRGMVRDDAQFFDPLGLVSRGTRIDFQVGVNAYLYGTRFFTWLAYAYSPEHVVAWLKRDEGSSRYYSDHFQQVFGIPLERAWQDWIAFERDFQKRNLEEVRKHPITAHRNLLPNAVGSVSRAYYDPKGNDIIGAFRYPGVVEHVGSLDIKSGEVRRLTDVKGAMLYRVTSLAWDPASRTAFYTNDNYALRDLMAINVDTGEERMLLEDARIGEIVYNPADRSILGVRHANGLATLVRIPYPYTEWNQVYTFPYGVVPYDLDVSPDGKLLSASCSEVNGDQFLRVWEVEKILAGDAKPRSQYAFGQSVPEGFVFSPDGRFLYGSSYYTGVSNIFRYEVATGSVEAVSNAEVGYFRPFPMPNGELGIFHFTGAGFVPAVIDPKVVKDASAIRFLGTEVAAKHPVVSTWQVPPPSTVDPAKLVETRGAYDPLKNLGLRGAYPVLQGYKEKVGLGYYWQIEDDLRFATLGITAAITAEDRETRKEMGHLAMKYQYLGWSAQLSWNRSDFYDMFGPTLRSRKGFAAVGGYEHAVVFDPPRRLDWKSEIAFYDQIDTLPDYQNVEAAGVERLITAETGLHYSFVRKSLGAVDDEKGLKWEAVANAQRVHGDVIGQGHATLDFGFALPLDHASFWVRSAAGGSGGNRDDPFANFFFGGFGNNYVDSRNEKRYREYYTFPGFGINEIGGKTFARSMAELNLPPYIFENVGTPSAYLTWLRPAVFASGLVTDPDKGEFRKRYASVGTQVDLRFSVLHWYDMTLSFGYAVGYKGGSRAGDEWMVSLKIM